MSFKPKYKKVAPFTDWVKEWLSEWASERQKKHKKFLSEKGLYGPPPFPYLWAHFISLVFATTKRAGGDITGRKEIIVYQAVTELNGRNYLQFPTIEKPHKSYIGVILFISLLGKVSIKGRGGGQAGSGQYSMTGI